MPGLDPGIHGFLYCIAADRAFAAKKKKSVDGRVKPAMTVVGVWLGREGRDLLCELGFFTPRTPR
jgi:hypothetical protein